MNVLGKPRKSSEIKLFSSSCFSEKKNPTVWSKITPLQISLFEIYNLLKNIESIYKTLK